MENLKFKGLYESYLEEAKNKYPSQAYASSIFQSPDKVLERYNDYNKIQDNFQNQLGLQRTDMAELNQSSGYSSEDYLKDDFAISFLTNNIKYYSKLNERSLYSEDINNSLKYLQELDQDQRNEYYNNNLSELQKRTLGLINVKDENDFSGALNAIGLNDSIEGGIFQSEVIDSEGNKKFVDVTLAEILKGVASGAGVGAGVGGLFAGVGALPGAIVGGVIGGLTELGDALSENAVIEGVNNAKRNFVSAVYGSTIGMVGDATAGIANIANVGMGKVANKDSSEIAKYNPLNYIEQVTDSLDQYLIEKQKDDYGGFSKFIVQDLPSVFGSLTGFAITGKVMAGAFGAGEIGVGVAGKRTFAQSVMNRFIGGSYAELTTRGLVSLQAMDETFDRLKAEGISDNRAFSSSLLNGGLNWSVLSFTEAIPGMRTSGKLADQFGKFAVRDIFRHIPMEMGREAVEEIGELASQEISMSIGLGQKEFSSIKDYLYTGFLGAIGGAFGAGLGTLNYRKMINETYDNHAKFNPEMVEGMKDTYIRQGMKEIEAKDRTIKELMDKGLNGIPDSVLGSMLVDQKEQFVEAVIKSDKYVKEILRPEAEEIINQTTDMDSSEENINKVMFLLNERNTNPSYSVKKEFTENIELFARAEDISDFDIIHDMNERQKNELSKLSQSQFNERITEIKEKGFNQFYERFDSEISGSWSDVIGVMKKFNVTNADIHTMYAKQLITQQQFLDYQAKYNKEMIDVKATMDAYIANPNKANITNAKNAFSSKEDLFTYIQDEYSKDTAKYLNVLKDFGLDTMDQNYNKLISIGNDIDTIMDFEIKDGNKQANAEQLQKIKTLKTQLKEEYGRLNRVPFELINKLNDNEISLEKISEVQSLLKEQLRLDKQVVSEKIKKEPLELIKSKGVLSATSTNDYYNSKVNKDISVSDKLRENYYTRLTQHMGSFKNISKDIKKKYNLIDYNDMIQQMVLDEKLVLKDKVIEMHEERTEVKEEEIYDKEKLTEKDGTIKLYHYSSDKNLSIIDPKKQGSSMDAGAEMETEFINDEIQPGYEYKSNFYTKASQVEDRFKGMQRYESIINANELYDANRNQMFLNAKDMQSVLKKKGYTGYILNGQVRLFNEIDTNKTTDLEINKNMMVDSTNKKIAQEAYNATVLNGGITQGMNYVSETAKEGLAIANPKYGIVVDIKEFTPDTIYKFIKDNKSELNKKGNYLGLWHNKATNKVSIDISVVSEPSVKVVDKARQDIELAVFDLKTFNEYFTGFTEQEQKHIKENNITLTKEQFEIVENRLEYNIDGKYDSKFRTDSDINMFDLEKEQEAVKQKVKGYEVKNKIIIPSKTDNPIQYVKDYIAKKISDNTDIVKLINRKEAKMISIEKLNDLMHVDRETELQTSDFEVERMIELVDKMITRGITQPLSVDYREETGEIVIGEGNHRLMIANWFGIKELPVSIEHYIGVSHGDGKFAQAPSGLDSRTLKHNIIDKVYNVSKPQLSKSINVKEYIKQDIKEKTRKSNDFKKELESLSATDIKEKLRIELEISHIIENTLIEESLGYKPTEYPVTDNDVQEELDNKLNRVNEDIYQLERDLKNLNKRLKKVGEIKVRTKEEVQNKVVNAFSEQLLPMENDRYIVKDKLNNMDIKGVGIDYENGYRTDITLYYNGDETNPHTFYYDKDKLIKELYNSNKHKIIVDDNGKMIQC